MFIVDAHLDLAYNALNKNRDPRRKLAELRAAEAPAYKRGIPTVSFSAIRRGGVGLTFATLFSSPADNPFPDNSEEDEAYVTPDEAHRLGMKQVDYYRRLVDEDESLRLVTGTAGLEEVLAGQGGETPLLGLVLLMEGADHIRVPKETELWVEQGVRIIGPAWDDTQYCCGAWRGSKEGLTKAGYALLDVMADLGLILDLTHMNEVATFQALDHYQGPVVATHSNARALVPGERQLSDTQIRHIGEREGVIGVVLYNAFLLAGWRKGRAKDLVTLDHIVAHIDHICQTIGDARHAGIGSDLDGGFGAADIPAELDSIADLPLIAGALREKGYDEDDIAGIMGLNWVNLLRRVWA
ncbi:MAG: membrane dipeptidase [Chloroflexota bacterium]|jgi:membrane dipeptidase